ncbi:MAG: hypothetical protein PWP65_1643 [Clostridia bacterium]|nr:hypothetical protein [Clostridia bacterium]
MIRRYWLVLYLFGILLGFFTGLGAAWAESLEKTDPLTLSDFCPQTVRQAVYEVGPGLYRSLFAGRTFDGHPLIFHVLEADLNNPLVDVQVVPGGPSLGQGATLSQLAASYGADAGLNGGYFYRGEGGVYPVGTLKVDNETYITETMWRPSLGISGGRKIIFGYYNPELKIYWPGGGIGVSIINHSFSGSEPVLYTSRWGKNTSTPAGTREIILERTGSDTYRVTGLMAGNAPIEPGRLVLALPDEGRQLPRPGQEVRVAPGAGVAWEQVEDVLTAGPLLVEAGKPVWEMALEGFTSNIFNRSPWSAVGLTADNKLLLVAVDGRSSESAGLLPEELSLLMLELGAVEAMALDGGGSTTFWAQGSVCNRPSDGSERELASALLVFSQVKVFINGERLYFDVPPRFMGDRVFVPFRKIFAALGAEVEWEESTATVRARLAGRQVSLKIGSRQALVNGETVELEAPAVAVEGRALVPVRFIAEALGSRVDWDASTQSVKITI